MTFRVIARLDIKPPDLVKGVHLEGFRKLGQPTEFAERYYQAGADEISYQDIVASLYERNSIRELVSETARRLFIPLTVGGGLRSAADATNIIRDGADKICLNTAAVRSPDIITDIARQLGSQAVVIGIEAKRRGTGWIAMTDSGREHTGWDVIEWADEVTSRGAGEILLTSVDQEGTSRGFDLELISRVSEVTGLPIVAHGGAGTPDHVVDAFRAGASAAAVASMLHYGRFTIADIKAALAAAGVEVRS